MRKTTNKLLRLEAIVTRVEAIAIRLEKTRWTTVMQRHGEERFGGQ